MTQLFWICAVGGAVLLVLGIVADGLLESVLPDDGQVVPVLGAFLGTFGIVGLVVSSLTDGNRVAAVLAGAIGGVALALVAGRMVRGALGMRTDATPTSGDLVGRSGRVVTPIAPSSAGEVLVRLSGQPLKLLARSDQELSVGTTVVVVQALSPSSVLVESQATFFGGEPGGTPP